MKNGPRVLVVACRVALTGDKSNNVRIFDAYRKLGYDVDFYGAYKHGRYNKRDLIMPDFSAYDVIHTNQHLMHEEREHLIDMIDSQRSPSSKFICWAFDSCNPYDPGSERKHKDIKRNCHKFDFFFATDGSYDWSQHGANFVHLFQGVEEDEFVINESIQPIYDTVFTGMVNGRHSPRIQLIQGVSNQFSIICNRFYREGGEVKLRQFPRVDKFVPRQYGQDFCDLYRSARSALMPLGYDGVKNYWSNRLYLITATGRPCVVGYVDGIENEFEVGREILTFTDTRDACEKISFLLNNPDVAESIGNAGRKRTLTNYKYSDRIKRIMELVAGND